MNTWKPTGPDRRSVDRLTQAAELTGGQAHSRFLGLGSPDPIETFARVFADFRTSYVLRYTATGVPRSGWHEIRVEVPTHPEATIRARRGYWAR